MRNIVLTLALVGIGSLGKAQQITNHESIRKNTSVGHWVVGLETDNLLLLKEVDGAGDDYFLRKIIPTVGLFATSNLIVGIGIPLGWAPREGIYYGNGISGPAGVYNSYRSYKQIGVSPFIQQFIGKGKIKPYVGASYRYTHQQLDFSIREVSVYIKQTGSESELSVFTGLSYFITPRLGVDVKLRYGWQQGNHPYVSFPNKFDSGYSSTYAYSGQTGSANVGLRYQLGR
jgi:hypothetical protein